jgi:hypothetical protein
VIYFSLPRVPATPARPEDLPAWVEAFRLEVERCLTEIQTHGVTRALVGWRGEQTIASGTTIDPTAPVIVLNATMAAFANATHAIGDGVDGQFLVLKNGSTNNITIPGGANTLLGGGTYVTLSRDDALALVWDGDDWVQLAPVSVNRGENVIVTHVVSSP